MKEAIQKAIEGGFVRKMHGTLPNTEQAVWFEEMHERWQKADPNHTETAIEKTSYYAGYGEGNRDSGIFLDPLFWQSLGKALGWGKCGVCGCGTDDRGLCVDCRSYEDFSDWKDYWHFFIDHLIEGKSPDLFFQDLLK